MIDTLVTGIFYAGFFMVGVVAVLMLAGAFCVNLGEKSTNVCLALILLSCFAGFLCFGLGNCISCVAENEVVGNCYEGIVVGKETDYVVSTSDITYTITFEAEYEYLGESKTTQREATVSEDTYFAYDVGDTFNANEINTSVSDSDIGSVSLEKATATKNFRLAIGFFLVGTVTAFLGFVAAFANTILALADEESTETKLILLKVITVSTFCAVFLVVGIIIKAITIVA